ncbi:MlaD family protein [Novosphingobium resinovorum]|uniref:Mammalian cell entry protein n=1 Tax=Novosphingobium resinovorum TaxID=158500 RepID=A0A031K533_9SPHN|nr:MULTISPECIES: MlaD family protein [Sphingomonadaceae]AOR76771.1 mammalian cell entry protein [Novosphingobium resinovorum]EJU10043.1 putative ABC transport system substrate-binding protein [Sphingomonas sp. LH128]EZP83712.1 putative ABC transport system substrate-binding protein [Novosphingobium resinovorum]MBF7012124.1 MCE family protein [Novosphingobium sp. HR1a]WJM26873.1 MlaD family protein [Novosphingobium resinovorum]
METKANHVWVGVVTLVLLAALAAFVIWIARLNEGAQNEYDIFFKQSVDGLAKGSEVGYAGVPSGQVTQIELWPQDPSFVRVRVKVDEKVPITVGTTATIQGSFTGVSDIQLEGAVKGAPLLTEPGPEGVPVIPTKRGGFGELLTNAPLLMERLATLTENLNQLMSAENRKSITGILANTDKMTKDLSQATPQLRATMSELQGSLQQATRTLAAFEGVAHKADNLLGDEGSSLADQLRKTLASAQKSMDQLDKTMAHAQPALDQVSEQTLPAAESAIRDLRATSKALRSLTEKIDEQGAGALLKGQKLPDYKP